MDSQPLSGLYAITAPELTPDIFSACEQALAGGARLIQYRNKQADAITRFKQVKQLLPLCHEYGARLIVNDESTLAKASGADGVHLGQSDGDIKAARDLLGPDKLIGVSCHGSLALAQQAVAAGADYVAFGRFFASFTKPKAEAADLDVLTQARTLGVPVIAIGGIDATNGAQLLAAGADLLAVIHGVFGQADIRAAAQSITDLFGKNA